MYTCKNFELADVVVRSTTIMLWPRGFIDIVVFFLDHKCNEEEGGNLGMNPAAI